MYSSAKPFLLQRILRRSATPVVHGTHSQISAVAFSQLLVEWFAANYWEPAHFSVLTKGCCPPSAILNVREVKHLLYSNDFELKPKYFLALSKVYAYLRSLSTANIHSFHDIYGLFSALPAIVDDAENSSWWFALYMGEEGMSDQFRRFEAPSLALEAIGAYLPGFVRKQISKQGHDPVSFLEDKAHVLTTSYMPQISRSYGDWLLGYKEVTNEELRVLLTLSVSLLADIDCTYGYFSELVDDLISSRKPLALKPSEDPSPAVGSLMPSSSRSSRRRSSKDNT